MQPGQQKISQFTPVESSHPDDIIPIVRNGQNRSIKVGKFTGTPPTGWTTPAEAWSFVSYSGVTGVIRIPEGQDSRYPKGTRVQFSQGTPATRRYGIVTEATTNRLTVRMIHGTLENKTISQNFVSQEFSPKTPENVDWTTEDVYSKDEVVVGVWFDGRPVYQKTLDVIVDFKQNQYINVPHGISDIASSFVIVSAQVSAAIGRTTGAVDRLIPRIEWQHQAGLIAIEKDSLVFSGSYSWGRSRIIATIKYVK